jgi:hypothetical protein
LPHGAFRLTSKGTSNAFCRLSLFSSLCFIEVLEILVDMKTLGQVGIVSPNQRHSVKIVERAQKFDNVRVFQKLSFDKVHGQFHFFN